VHKVRDRASILFSRGILRKFFLLLKATVMRVGSLWANSRIFKTRVAVVSEEKVQLFKKKDQLVTQF
jgi:hypothetical protein